MARSAILNVMVNAVLKAGRSLARDFGEVENLQVSVKGPGDFVAQAARKAGQTLQDELQKGRPGYSYLSARTGAIDGDDAQHRWIVEPLDGATNFLHGIPLFAISVALERQGQLAAAVVYNPAMDELCTAERGGGAFLNDRRMRVAARRDLADAIVATGIPHLGRANHPRALGQLQAIAQECAGIRGLGSTVVDLTWLASGRCDGFWENARNPWHVAAGALLVREAGGFVSGLDGRPEVLEAPTVVAGNEAIHGALLRLLAKSGA